MNGVVLAAVLLALTACAVQKREPDLSPRAAFADACRLSRYDCTDVPQPMIRESKYVNEEGAHGFYKGGHTVWLRTGLGDVERYIVTVHEMVHYLQLYVDEEGVPLTNSFERCVAEEEAFEVSDIVAARLNRPKWIRNGNLMSYGCGIEALFGRKGTSNTTPATPPAAKGEGWTQSRQSCF